MSNKAEPTSIPDLAIVGIGCLFPRADSPGEYWSNIREGVDAITEVPDTHWDPADYFNADQTSPDMTYARRGGFIAPQDFNPLLYGLSPNNIEATDTTQLLGLVVARQALLDAGYSTGKDAGDGREFDRDRTSVILGVTGTLELVIPLGARLGHPVWRKALKDAGVDPQTAEDVVQRIAESYVAWQENSFPGLLGNVVAGRIANRFDLGGTNCVVDAACASSLSAIHLAALELATGRADMVITGGMDTFNDIFMYMCFSKTPALSPTGDSRPFAEDGDGTILGEGLGAIILKRLEDAGRDGDTIYAVLKGMGSSSDGRGNAIYAPSADGQIKALWNAYRAAGVTPRSIELVEAHGTGTAVGDAVEAAALSAVYRQDNDDETWCAVGSVKSMIGHTKAAAGIAGLIKTALALKHKVLPPSIKIDKPLAMIEPGTAPIYLNTIKRPWLKTLKTPRRAALSSFGFGGSNFHCVLEEATATKNEIDWDGRVIIVALSADTKTALLERLPGPELAASWKTLRRFAFDSCQSFIHDAAHRITIVLEQADTDRIELFTRIKTRLAETEEIEWRTPAVSYSTGTLKPKIAFVFPGQGSQYAGMGRDLACQFPGFLSALQEADTVFSQTAGESLTDIIYPLPVFNDADRNQQQQTLRQTHYAQPAIGAISLGALRVLKYFGIEADLTVGHSYGELTALYAAGYYDSESLHRLSCIRGDVMNRAEGDRGSMLAVMAGYAQVKELLDANDNELVIANHNAPNQVVLSGSTKRIEEFTGTAGSHKISVTRLPVAAAFHSRFVADAVEPFAAALAEIPFCENRIPALSNTTAAVYPRDADSVRTILSEQLAKPVRFVEQIERLYAEGVHTFIEAGPGKTLTGLVNAILASKAFTAVAVDTSAGKKPGQYDLALLLATLAANGIHCELAKWDRCPVNLERPVDDKKPALTVSVSGANRRSPHAPLPPRQPKQDTAVTMHRDNALTSAQTVTDTAPQTTVTPRPATPANDLAQAIQANILALQKMQEQTARIHRQYLAGQETAQNTIQGLLDRQQPMFGAAPSATEEPVTEPPAAVQQQAKIEPAISAPPAATTATPPAAEVKADEQGCQPGDVDIDNLLLTVVAEKTGYPMEMLSLDMSLDTDLGIDSIKRVEILSTIQERLPWSPVVKPEVLGTFQFLQHIVEFIHAGRPPAETTKPPGAEQQTSVHGDFEGILLEVVAEKTGYPVAMLALDMDLDNDLGIDSIKRVEILSALQERRPELPSVGADDLARLKTLSSIVRLFDAQRTPPENAVTRPIQETGRFAELLLAVVADKTGYPVDMLALEMNLDSDLGIDSIKRVEILSALQERLPELPAISPDAMGGLQTLQSIIDVFSDREDLPPTGPVAKPKAGDEAERSEANAIEPAAPVVRRVVRIVERRQDNRQTIPFNKDQAIWINENGGKAAQALAAALAADGYATELIAAGARPTEKPAGLIICAPEKFDQHGLLSVFKLIQTCGRSLQDAKGLLTTVTTLGGSFGFAGQVKADPVQAGLHGIVKTAAIEWPDVHCKSIDIDADTVAVDLIREELFCLGPLEVGLADGRALQLELEPKALAYRQGRYLNREDCLVISGGARGVTAEVAVKLAETYRCNLLLLGRSPEAGPEPDWLSALTQPAEIKKAILENTERELRPADLEQRYQSILANRAIQTTLDKIKQTGVRVKYGSADVTDAQAVEHQINLARMELGGVTGIIHAAGVLADSLIDDKTADQFNRVYATKVNGLQNLLAATANDNLKLIVLFSSATARSGRRGQADYAAANEILNKFAVAENQQRENCKVLSVNWGPWNGGMVTASLKQVFAGEGVGVIGLDAGAEYLVQEIEADGPVETVVTGAAGSLWSNIPLKTPKKTSPVDFNLAFERALCVDSHAFLTSHVMNGQAVLPVAMMIEWFAHAAVHLNPGMQFQGFDDLRVLKGVTLKAAETMRLRILAGTMKRTGDKVSVPVELRSDEYLHADGMVMLADAYEKNVLPKLNAVAAAYPLQQTECYQNGPLFHGRHLRGIKAVTHCGDNGIVAGVNSAPAPSAWMRQPIRSDWLADPLILDSAFQMMIVWSFRQTGIGCLPTAITRYRQYRRNYPNNGATVIAAVTRQSACKAISSIEFLDDKAQLIASMEGYECVRDESLAAAFRENALDLEAE